MIGNLKTFRNGEALPLTRVPRHDLDDFLQGMVDSIDGGWRVISYFGVPTGDGVVLYAVLGLKKESLLGIMSTAVSGTFPSLTPYSSQLHLFEREIAEQFGLVPEGHPWLKPVRFERPFRETGSETKALLPSVMEFYQVTGEEVHEVAVGPVHAGIIEPGHFRFQCHGEVVFHLEISLGYQHRGVEKALLAGPHPRSIYQIETVAGDTTIGHTQAYAMVLEALTGTVVPPRGEAIRAIALELERLANHTGDLGAIAGDVGYLPTASYCGRIRGEFLNMTAHLTGSRFGRGMVRPGGTGFDCTTVQAEKLMEWVVSAGKDLGNAVNLLWNSPSVMARLEQTGTVTAETAVELGLVGPAARASGLSRDVRSDYPFGGYRTAPIPTVTTHGGDVHARTLIRWLEADKSLDYLVEQLHNLPGGGHRNSVGTVEGEMVAVALTEGWRGEICHVGITDAAGRFSRYKVTDPSFHNWSGLALALRGEQISDFPLCNKSFNLSYCGFDL